MKPDFEEKLSRQPVKEIPPAWRAEILSAARKAQVAPHASLVTRHAWLSTLNLAVAASARVGGAGGGVGLRFHFECFHARYGPGPCKKHFSTVAGDDYGVEAAAETLRRIDGHGRIARGGVSEGNAGTSAHAAGGNRGGVRFVRGVLSKWSNRPPAGRVRFQRRADGLRPQPARQ